MWRIRYGLLIFLKDPGEHLRHIETIFKRIRQHGLKLKLKKCNFFNEETDYLGFVISIDEIKPDPKKVEAIRDLQEPKSVREIRGMWANIEDLFQTSKESYWFDKEIHNNQMDFRMPDSLWLSLGKPHSGATISLPWYQQALRLVYGYKQQLHWSMKTQKIYNNAEEKPIYFLSHKLSPTQTRWSIIEKEGYAIYYVLHKLDHYLHSARFTTKTDHTPLKYILDSPMQD